MTPPPQVYRPSPDHHVDLVRPAVFLAGPIQGAPDWQSLAIEKLRGEDIDVFSPRSLGMVPAYETQVSWERAHLDRAGRCGVIMFWLANPLPLTWAQRLRVLRTGIPSRPHAQTSRLELGWELARNVLGDARHGAKGTVVVGMEPGFSNERFIRRLVETEIGGAFRIHATLDETVRATKAALAHQGVLEGLDSLGR